MRKLTGTNLLINFASVIEKNKPNGNQCTVKTEVLVGDHRYR
jgi:hypothetical protein